jgi:membrane associated rhomboid family serine protease
MFLHANLTHLVGNLVFLATFGAIAENELGSVRFTALYFAAGVCGALLHVTVDPYANNAMVGCSGCLFGLIALVAARRPRFLGFALAFGAVEVWHALSGGETSVSFGAHLGGLAAGVLFAMIMRATSCVQEERFA